LALETSYESFHVLSGLKKQDRWHDPKQRGSWDPSALARAKASLVARLPSPADAESAKVKLDNFIDQLKKTDLLQHSDEALASCIEIHIGRLARYFEEEGWARELAEAAGGSLEQRVMEAWRSHWAEAKAEEGDDSETTEKETYEVTFDLDKDKAPWHGLLGMNIQDVRFGDGRRVVAVTRVAKDGQARALLDGAADTKRPLEVERGCYYVEGFEKKRQLNAKVKQLRASQEKKITLVIKHSGRSDLDPVHKEQDTAKGNTNTLRIQCTSDLHKVTMTPMKRCGSKASGYEACEKPIDFPKPGPPSSKNPSSTTPQHLYVTLKPPATAILLKVTSPAHPPPSLHPICNPPSSYASCEAASATSSTIQTTKGFPSYTLPLPPVTKRYCYSVTLDDPGLAQVGFARPTFSPDPGAGKGCGDDSDSWGFDGSRVFKWHEGGTKWGWSWKKDDVVWLGYDPERGEVYAEVEGKGCRLGDDDTVMFDNVWGRLNPCLTVNKSCRLTVDFAAKREGWMSVAEVKEGGAEGGAVQVDAWEGDRLRRSTAAAASSRGQARKAGGVTVEPPPKGDNRVWVGDKLDGGRAVAFERVRGTDRYQEPRGWVRVAQAESGMGVYRPVPFDGYKALGCVLREEGEERDNIVCVHEDECEYVEGRQRPVEIGGKIFGVTAVGGCWDLAEYGEGGCWVLKDGRGWDGEAGVVRGETDRKWGSDCLKILTEVGGSEEVIVDRLRAGLALPGCDARDEVTHLLTHLLRKREGGDADFERALDRVARDASDLVRREGGHFASERAMQTLEMLLAGSTTREGYVRSEAEVVKDASDLLSGRDDGIGKYLRTLDWCLTDGGVRFGYSLLLKSWLEVGAVTQERTQIDEEEEIEIKGANGLRVILAPDTDLKGGRIELHGEREVKKKKSTADSSASPTRSLVVETVKVEINDKTDKSLTHKFLGSKVRVKFVRGPSPPPPRVETAAAKSVVDAALAPLKPPARSTSTGSESGEQAQPKFSFTVTGLNVSGPSRLSSLAKHLRCYGPDIFAWPYVKDLKGWTSENDSKLVLWINESTRTGDRSDKRTAFDFVLKKADLRHPLTFLDTSKGLLSLRLRVACLQNFNSMVYKCVPLIDVTSTERQSLGFRLRHSTDIVFEDQKKRSLKAALEVTQGSGGNSTTVILDNFLASKSLEKGPMTIDKSDCIFVQAFKDLKNRPSVILRSVWDGDRVFQVSFRGESGSDAGGVFREGMQRIVEDLFMDYFDLFVPCPNNKHEINLNREKFIPNPTHSGSNLAMEMYEFVGKVMGASLRTNLALPFHFPSYVWKGIAGLEVGQDDLAEADSLFEKWLRDILECEEEMWEWSYGSEAEELLKWTCTGADGTVLTVKDDPGPVPFQKRREYVKKVIELRSEELKPAIDCIKRGMYLVVPERALNLYTWREVEVLVCGNPTFDMADWKNHTHYSGYSSDDDVIKTFWRVMESLTDEEKSMFVRFVWGRSRLPARGQAWTTNFHITKRGNVNALPQAHTCFNSLELPPYGSEKLLREKILLACHYGVVGILNT